MSKNKIYVLMSLCLKNKIYVLMSLCLKTYLVAIETILTFYFQFWGSKINQQTIIDLYSRQIVNKLDFMSRNQAIYRFQFHDDRLLHQQVYPKLPHDSIIIIHIGRILRLTVYIMFLQF